ncbi:MAG: orotate phosphoribosyltransferase [Chlamydiota bacterium]
MRDIILRLHDIEAIKFGDFRLKSGIESPFYIDLRLITSYPILLKSITEEMWKKINEIDFEVICGVPLTAIPMATAISLDQNIPMIMRRKEVKKHGTKKVIEGVYRPGQRCVIVEDLITSGISILETVEPLKQEGLIVKDVVLLIDREQGGRENLEERNINLHAVMTISDILSVLIEENRIEKTVANQVNIFINQNQRVLVGS